ncbi:uncharacterized protein LOC131801229 [Musca domestica]|uniref:Uncharacterized protein LOC105262004 n=1 Tax=Musca domestica TaxID=7370 RepID=A0A9J7I9D6_MUSDO|nr:uncharacterized protein LOC105262004 [Musca domestica]XP_058975567.1 uncharacterized protein LOC131801229 [Musca domestica]
MSSYYRFLFVVLFVLLPCCCYAHPGYSYGKGQGQYGGYVRGPVVYRNDVIQDFEYVPTVQGYRYNYVLNDGTSRNENVLVAGTPSSPQSKLDGKNTDLTAVGVGGRHRMPTKNRKLAPGALKSLAG